jgi:hypothetical protein
MSGYIALPATVCQQWVTSGATLRKLLLARPNLCLWPPFTGFKTSQALVFFLLSGRQCRACRRPNCVAGCRRVMPSNSRRNSNFFGPEPRLPFSSVDSELHYRSTARAMDRHGSTTPPLQLQDSHQSYNDNLATGLGDRDYPPRWGQSLAGHMRDTSTTSVKSAASDSKDIPRVFGLPLKYVSCVIHSTLTAHCAPLMSRHALPAADLSLSPSRMRLSQS